MAVEGQKLGNGLTILFMAMHTSPAHAEANQRAKPLLDGDPSPEFYEVEVG